MLTRSLIVLFTLLFLGAAPALAFDNGNERSLKDIHDEFMGYAKEYYDEAKHYEKKARRASGSERSKLQELSRLSKQMGGVKEDMARGYLKDNHSAVKKAEKKYYQLSDKREAILKKFKKH